MTLPRIVRPGQVWFLTRRTTRRHFLLHPDRDGTAQQLYWFATAVVARELSIDMHVTQGLSNHMHEIVTDNVAKIPKFLEERNRLYANSIKCHRGWPEEVFSRKATSCVALDSAEAVVQQMAYTLANCVEAGLVDSPEQWPGVSVNVDDIGRRVMRIERPAVYYDPQNPRWPPFIEIEIKMPEILVNEYGSEDAAREVIRQAVDEKVSSARAALKRAGRYALGVKRLFRIPFTKRASSHEEVGARSPQFASGGNREAARLAIRTRRGFIEAYRDAYDQFRRGVTGVLFPFGTWRMRVCFGALCRGPDDN